MIWLLSRLCTNFCRQPGGDFFGMETHSRERGLDAVYTTRANVQPLLAVKTHRSKTRMSVSCPVRTNDDIT